MKTRVLIVALALTGCVHPGSNRGPASVDAQAWQASGPCGILNVGFPLDANRTDAQVAYRMTDPKTEGTFLTATPEACKAQRFKIGPAAGTVENLEVITECQNYGGRIASETEKPGLVRIYLMADPRGKLRFRTLDPRPCQAQGFVTEPDRVGYANP